MTTMYIPEPRRRQSYLQRLLALLSDCRWHSYQEVFEAAGKRYSARLLELIRLGYVIEKRAGQLGRDYRLVSTQRTGVLRQKRVKWYLTESSAQALYLGQIDRLAPEDRAALRDALLSFREHRDQL